jgi:hypothetical protein
MDQGTRDAMLRELIQMNRSLGRVIVVLESAGESHVAIRLVEAQRATAAAAIAVMEGRC